jgi:hypothetical protein
MRGVGWKLQSTGRVSAVAQTSTAFLLGQGILAGLWLLLALSAKFSWPVIVVVLALCVLAGISFAWHLMRKCVYQLGAVFLDLKEEPFVWQGTALLTLLLIGVACMPCFTPLVPGWDASAFYMVLPKVIASSQRLVPFGGYETFTAIGLQGELHFAALMSLTTPETARLFVLPISLANALLLLALGRQAGLGRRGQWIALGILFSSSAFTISMGDGKVESFATALGIGAFYWALMTEEGRQENAALRIVGLLSGLAVVAKITYLVVLLPGIALLILWRRVLSHQKIYLRSLLPAAMALTLRLGLWMSIALLPHLVKNGVLFGEPLAPFLGFGSSNLQQTWLSVADTRRLLLTYPLALVYGKFGMQSFNLSPLFLAFAPLAFFVPRPASILRSRLFQVTISALAGLVIWTVLRPSVFALRYFLAPLLVLILGAARGGEYVSLRVVKPLRLDAAVVVSILLALLIAMKHVLILFPYGIPYMMGEYKECDYVGLACLASGEINDKADLGDRVLTLTYITYWLRSDLLQCKVTSEEMYSLLDHHAEENWTYLCERGFRFILFKEDTHSKYGSCLKLPDGAPEWMEVRQIFRREPWSVYHISCRDGTRQPLCSCRQINPPAWDVVAR